MLLEKQEHLQVVKGDQDQVSALTEQHESQEHPSFPSPYPCISCMIVLGCINTSFCFTK